MVGYLAHSIHLLVFLNALYGIFTVFVKNCDRHWLGRDHHDLFIDAAFGSALQGLVKVIFGGVSRWLGVYAKSREI
jgi:hypothetical protein